MDPSKSEEETLTTTTTSSSTSSMNLSMSMTINGGETDKEKEKEAKKRQKLDEYCAIEEKQARLLRLLNERVYKQISETNGIEQDEMHRVFYVIVELEQLASMVHEQVASDIRRRMQTAEWYEKPYCGDILLVYYHYYKVYKAILARYPTCQCTLSNLLKRKPFAAQLKKLLVCNRFFRECL